jgi:preprotein translocase subunit SecB
MADGNGNGGAAQGAPDAPALNALGQYLKDLSFENPNAPRSLGPQEKAPNIGIQVNVNAKQLAPTDFEVSISLDAKAGEGADLLFKLDLEYAGVFRLTNIPEDQMHPIVMIECPRLLFPPAVHRPYRLRRALSAESRRSAERQHRLGQLRRGALSRQEGHTEPASPPGSRSARRRS